MKPVDAVLVLRARPNRAGSARDVAIALGGNIGAARALLVRLCKLGSVRSLRLKDSYGWTLFALVQPRPVAPGYVRAALRNRNPLRSLVLSGCGPVARAAEAIERERAA